MATWNPCDPWDNPQGYQEARRRAQREPGNVDFKTRMRWADDITRIASDVEEVRNASPDLR